MRFVTDFRGLNKVTVPDNYSLPHIDDILMEAKARPYMSIFDLRNCYWQVPIVPECKRYFSTVTPHGTFCYTRMPMGARNSAAYCQRIVETMLRELVDVIFKVYQDDLILLSETFAKHLSDVEQVFSCCRKTVYGLKRSKCVLFADKVDYLGHVVSAEGVSPNMAKIDAVLQLQYPTEIKHLKSFIASVCWFGKYIPNMADIATSLY